MLNSDATCRVLSDLGATVMDGCFPESQTHFTTSGFKNSPSSECIKSFFVCKATVLPSKFTTTNNFKLLFNTQTPLSGLLLHFLVHYKNCEEKNHLVTVHCVSDPSMTQLFIYYKV